MKPAAFFVVVSWALFGFLGLGFSSAPSIAVSEAEFEPDFKTESSVPYNYDRIDEVKKECKSVLSSASQLKPDDNIVYSIQGDLYLEKGDWFQVKGENPIMPFDGRYRIEKDSTLFNSASNRDGDPLKLVSFQVRDVSLAHRSKKSVSISGTLNLAITTGGESYGYGVNPEFQIWPGISYLVIEFQGVYTESEKNGGERVVCMLGNAMLPSRESESANPWEWVNASLPYSNEHPPLSQDDRIMLVLRFPKKFSLTSRAIQGEMRSLNAKSNQKYFDDVHIVSQLVGRENSSIYEFTSDRLVSKACDPYLYNKTDSSLLIPGVSVYKGNPFCDIFEEITSNQPFTVLPNWNCSGKDEFCSKLGPFGTNKEINKTDGGFKGVGLYIKLVKCVQSNGPRNTSSARLSVEFRASPPSESPYTATRRSGIGNLTVAAEGIWNSTSGQLCMVGCPGIVDPEGNDCDSRISLYIPTSFSVKQRSIMYGTFSSIRTNTPSYFPLSFEKLINHPSDLWNYFRGSHPSYSYSKVTRADAILERNEEFSLRTMIKKSLLKYPKLKDAEDYKLSLSLLSEDLTFHTPATPDSSTPKTRLQRTNIQMDILSVGPLFGRYFSRNSSYFSAVEGETETPYHTKAEYTENQLLLNVSGQLTVTGEEYSNISVLFVEGIYDQRVGKMYLVGCRDVRASWEILHESQDLEAGLDCLIDVIVSYPPTTSRWLVNPLARISIASQRNDDDPLRFSQVKFQTFPITYRKQREDLLSSREIEGILRILTLSFAIACITAQLFHTQKNTDSVPYMSLVMLGVQAIGYSIPLVTGAEALFKKASSESYQSSYDLESSRWSHILDYTVKLLVMASLLLTLRLFQKVWKSRVRLLTRAPLEPHRVPSDKKVLLSTIVIHLIGYLLVLILHSTRGDQRTRSYAYIGENSHVLSEWEAELEEYVGLVQDFFLLPQVIGNLIWQIDCQSLRKLYYIGITLVRLLPHLYDYVRGPDIPYFPEEYEFVDPSMDFYSKFGDVAIVVMAIVLAVLVYVQQKLSYEKLSQSLTFGRCRLLPSASRIYERLPSSSKAFEAELTSGVNGVNDANEKDHDLE